MVNLQGQVIEDVKSILKSGDEGVIKTLKINIKAYLRCIEINRRQKEIDRLEDKIRREL